MGISIWQLLIVLGIVLLLFGTKKLRNLGTDLGSAVKGFKSAVKDGGAEPEADTQTEKLEQHEDGAAGDTAQTNAAAEAAGKERERA